MKLLKLLVFVFFVIGSLGVPEELFVMDCSGGVHLRKPGNTNFYDQGVDLGILKRAIDEAVAIVHEHVSCKCSAATARNLEDSFTPSLKVILRAMTGYKGDTMLSESCNTNQLDVLLGGLLPDDIATNPDHPQLPNTCNYAHWQAKKQCSFKIDFPSNPVIGSDFSMYFAFSECPNSIWPHVSVSASGSFATSFLKPCTTHSECGTMKCGVVLKADDKNALLQEDVLSMFNESLWHAEIYKQESCPAMGDVPRFVANQLVNFVINRLIGQPSTYQLGDSLSMCGMAEFEALSNFTLTDTSTAAIRHRGIMKRAVSSMKKYPISQYINDLFDNVKNRGLNDVMDTVSNLGINDMLVDASKKLGFIYGEDVVQARSLLQDVDVGVDIDSFLPKPKEWDTTNSGLFEPNRLNGEYYNHFFPEAVRVDSVNLLRITTCGEVPAINIMGGSAKRYRSYVLKFPEVFKLLADTIRSAVDCRPALKTLNNNQFLTRFFPIDPIFWQKIFVDVTELHNGLGNDGYDVLKLVNDGMNLGLKVEMPSTCSFERMFNEGICAFGYNNLSPLFNGADVSIVFDYRRCNTKPNAFTVSIDCVGTDCQRMFDPFSIPCSAENQNARCGADGQCQLFELCDPLGLIWNASEFDPSPKTDFPSGVSSCAQDSSNDQCISTASFRNRIVKAMLKINQDTTTAILPTDDGMCIPAVFSGASEFETWEKDAFVFTDTTNPNTLTIKGLDEFQGVNWNEIVADGGTPRPDGTFVPPNSGSKLSFSVSIFFGLSLLVLS